MYQNIMPCSDLNVGKNTGGWGAGKRKCCMVAQTILLVLRHLGLQVGPYSVNLCHSTHTVPRTNIFIYPQFALSDIIVYRKVQNTRKYLKKHSFDLYHITDDLNHTLHCWENCRNHNANELVLFNAISELYDRACISLFTHQMVLKLKWASTSCI
jgi:hypothetical protein